MENSMKNTEFIIHKNLLSENLRICVMKYCNDNNLDLNVKVAAVHVNEGISDVVGNVLTFGLAHRYID